jgi:uncharacterized membrane protein YfcA
VAFFVVCAVALGASLLTFFTGFGLGTLLLPAFVAFFPVEVAVGLTAVVHFMNGLFKLVLVGRHADPRLALRFGLPAIAASFLGAWVLMRLSGVAPLGSYAFAGAVREVTLVKLVVAVLMVGFAVLEFPGRLSGVRVSERYAPLGGLLTGFFGGLSGHQGALRSAFLVRSGLSTEAFVATGVLVAVGVDFTRLTVYWGRLGGVGVGEHGPLLLAATLAAFSGAFLGSRLLKKVTLRAIQRAVAVLLLAVAAGLATGIL